MSTYLSITPPYAIGSVPSLSSHAIAYRWRSLLRVRQHRVSKPQGSSEQVLPWQVTTDQLICASLSHTHYCWYEVGMLIEGRKHKVIEVIQHISLFDVQGHPFCSFLTPPQDFLEGALAFWPALPAPAHSDRVLFIYLRCTRPLVFKEKPERT